MLKRAPILAVALLCGTLLAQTQGIEAVDVHVLQLLTRAGELIPAAEIVAAKRIFAAAPEGERRVSVRIGGVDVAARLLRDEDGGIRIERKLGRSTNIGPPRSRTLDVPEPFRFGRRPRHGAHVRGALLCEPVLDTARPFVPLDAKGFMRSIVDFLFEEERVKPLMQRIRVGHVRFEWGTPRWKAALVLGAVPLDDYLSDDQIDRILEAGAKLSAHIDDQSWPFLRPLIVLSDRATLDALARRSDEGDYARYGAGVVLAPHVPRTIEDSVLVAYAAEADPEIRGLAGWVAMGTRSPELYDMLAKDVRSGRAILPGDEVQRAKLAQHIVEVRAWQSITAPVLTLVASALGIGAIMLLVRAAVRRLF